MTSQHPVQRSDALNAQGYPENWVAPHCPGDPARDAQAKAPLRAAWVESARADLARGVKPRVVPVQGRYNVPAELWQAPAEKEEQDIPSFTALGEGASPRPTPAPLPPALSVRLWGQLQNAWRWLGAVWAASAAWATPRLQAAAQNLHSGYAAVGAQWAEQRAAKAELAKGPKAEDAKAPKKESGSWKQPLAKALTGLGFLASQFLPVTLGYYAWQRVEYLDNQVLWAWGAGLVTWALAHLVQVVVLWVLKFGWQVLAGLVNAVLGVKE